MISYRLYKLNINDRIVARVDFDADDDGEAVATAAARCPEDKWELWELGRRVAAAAATPRPAQIIAPPMRAGMSIGR
jgi:hypothetical protein